MAEVARIVSVSSSKHSRTEFFSNALEEVALRCGVVWRHAGRITGNTEVMMQVSTRIPSHYRGSPHNSRYKVRTTERGEITLLVP